MILMLDFELRVTKDSTWGMIGIRPLQLYFSMYYWPPSISLALKHVDGRRIELRLSRFEHRIRRYIPNAR